MSKLRVHNFAISLDGYGAGPNQDLDNPLGVGGLALHDWIVPTRTFQQIQGNDGGEGGVHGERGHRLLNTADAVAAAHHRNFLHRALNSRTEIAFHPPDHRS